MCFAQSVEALLSATRAERAAEAKLAKELGAKVADLERQLAAAVAGERKGRKGSGKPAAAAAAVAEGTAGGVQGGESEEVGSQTQHESSLNSRDGECFPGHILPFLRGLAGFAV